MTRSVKYFILFAAVVGFGAAPAWAQGKGSRTREEQPSGAKADRGQGGAANADRSNRSRSRRGEKTHGDQAGSGRETSSNKRKR